MNAARNALKRIRASKAGQYLLCPGSWYLEQDAPEGEETPEAAEGTLCHRAVYDQGAYLRLDEEQQELVDLCRNLRVKLGTGCMIVQDGTEEITASGPGDWYFTGTPDFFCVREEDFTDAEWKFGRLGLVETPVVVQLTVYGHLTMAHLERAGMRRDRGTGFAFNPRTKEQMRVFLDRDEVRDRLNALCQRIEKGEGEYHPQPHACRYCKALAICPAVERQVEVAVRDTLALTPDRRAARREFRELAIAWAEKVQKDDWQHLQSGGEIPGWELRAQKGNREIPDPVAAFRALHPLVDHEEMLGTMKPSVTSLEALVVGKLQGANPKLRKKEAVATFEAKLGAALTRAAGFAKLVRSKGGSDT